MREIQRHINLDALAANFLILRKLVAQSEVAAVVKADCYGLGVNKIAPALSNAGCETFYIATLEEGLQLRQLLPLPPDRPRLVPAPLAKRRVLRS